jgi:hypothetical protein
MSTRQLLRLAALTSANFLDAGPVKRPSRESAAERHSRSPLDGSRTTSPRRAPISVQRRAAQTTHH